MLGVTVAARFEPVRLKIVRAPIVAAHSITIPISASLPRTGISAPYAAILRVTHGEPSRASFRLRAGDKQGDKQVCSADVEPGRSVRIDCEVGLAEPASFSIDGPASFTVDYLELATHHGNTGRWHRAWIVPVRAQLDTPPFWMAIVAGVLLFGLFLVAPFEPLPRGVRGAQRLATMAVLALSVAALAAPRVSQFRLALAPSTWLLWAGLASATRIAGLVSRARRWSGMRAGTAAAATAVSLALAAGLFSAVFGVRTAAAADHFGYVSQAYLWTQGTLVVAIPPVPMPAVPDAPHVVTTLGYTIGPAPHTLVPTYPPGLPLLMAAGLILLGAWGPFVIVPIAVAAAVFGTFALGRRIDSIPAGLIAATFLACSPAFIYMGLWPMSDVPAAAAWTWCLWAATGRGPLNHAAAGALAGLAILIRPNLVLLALPAAWMVWQQRASGRHGWWAGLAAYAAPVVPAVLFLASFNAELYGSPMRSGYGDLGPLFSSEFVPVNARNYASWFLESQGVLMSVLAIVAVGRAGIVGPGAQRPLVLVVALLAALYLPYVAFDAWWFLRFFVPGYPALFVLIGSTIWSARRRSSWRFSRAVALAVVALATARGLDFINTRQPTTFHRSQHRFAVAGAYVRAALPPNAAFVAVEHSGSLRFYGNRLTIRYDWLNAGSLRPARAALEDAGYVVYAVVDEDELPRLRERFRAPGELSFLEQPPVATIESTPAVHIYALSDDVPSSSTVSIPLGRAAPVPPVSRRMVTWEPPR